MPDVLVRGVGLLGTSVALALTEVGHRVFLEDVDPDAVRVAAAMGAGQVDTPDVVDIVFVAVPPRVIATEVAAALRRFPDATVTDVGSVKSAPLHELRALDVDLGRYVGGHPMAGREIAGAAGGRADLFEDRPWILTPSSETDSDRVAQVRALAETMHAVVRIMAADAHDHAVAVSSHAPQVVASLLAAQLLVATDSDVAVAGPGVRDTTRIAASNPDLWVEILRGNSEQVAAVLAGFQHDVEAFTKALAVDDPVTMRALLSRGVAGRDRLPDKHGGRTREYRTVSVVVEDRAGQLGALFDLAGRAGVSVEDLRIEHSLGRLRAIVHVSVKPDAEQALRDALRVEGWHTRS